MTSTNDWDVMAAGAAVHLAADLLSSTDSDENAHDEMGRISAFLYELDKHHLARWGRTVTGGRYRAFQVVPLNGDARPCVRLLVNQDRDLRNLLHSDLWQEGALDHLSASDHESIRAVKEQLAQGVAFVPDVAWAEAVGQDFGGVISVLGMAVAAGATPGVLEYLRDPFPG